MRNKFVVFFMKILLKILYIFPVKINKICLLCFDGTKIGYDAKAIVDYVNTNRLDYKMVWLVKNHHYRKKFKLQNVRFEKYKSLIGIIELMSSKIIVYNVTVPPQIPYRKNQILINTWHGFGYKSVGKYVKGQYSKKTFEMADCMLSHSHKYTEWIIKDSFQYSGIVINSGVPRNDIFFSDKCSKITRKVKREFGIEDKKVALYAPTFRGNFKCRKSPLDFELIRKALGQKFGGSWVIMYRLHPILASKYSVNDDRIFDVSLYEDMQELLCSADVLITDYSSCSWDYSLLKRPIFLFVDDFDEYERHTAYISYEDLPYIVAKTNKELFDKILSFDDEEYQYRLHSYMEFCGSFENGTACQQMFSFISERLKTSEKEI